MTPVRIFISSVQREFAREREQLRDYLRGDSLMRCFFEVFLSEETPASDRRPDRACLDEVDRCDIYVGLFGRDYGSEDTEGVSPTEREFERATESGKHRLIFVKGAEGSGRHPRMEALIVRAQPGQVPSAQTEGRRRHSSRRIGQGRALAGCQPENRQKTTRKQPENRQKRRPIASTPVPFRPHPGCPSPESIRGPPRGRRHPRHHAIPRPVPAGQVACGREDRAGRSRQGRLLEGAGRIRC